MAECNQQIFFQNETKEPDKIDKYNHFSALEIDQRDITIQEACLFERL